MLVAYNPAPATDIKLTRAGLLCLKRKQMVHDEIFTLAVHLLQVGFWIDASYSMHLTLEHCRHATGGGG